MIRLTLNELRLHIREVLYEYIDRSDFERIMRKLERSEPFTEADIASFAEMTIDFHADDTKFRIAEELIVDGWDFLKYLTTPTTGGKNRQQVVERLRGTCKNLGGERAGVRHRADWNVKEEVDFKIDEFLLYTVEDYAKKIVGGYNKDVLERLRREKIAKEEERRLAMLRSQALSRSSHQQDVNPLDVPTKVTKV